MEVIKKIDTSSRIRIPIEMQHILNWKVNDYLKLEIVNNNIILSKCNSTSDQKELIEFPNNGDEENNYIKQVKEESEYNLTRTENIKIPNISQLFNKPKIDLLDNKDELNDRLCPKCRQVIENSRFKLNNTYICRDCRDKLRDEIYLSNKDKEE